MTTAPTSALATLFATIESRKANPTEGSYTARLFAMGENEICKKVGEEAVEVIVAAKGETEDRIIYEMADLVYHSMVLLAARGLTWVQVEEELARRFK
ncbi:MAG: phosphoribosyl-ATP diphosphatase [Caldilineaceae bacterium]